MPKNVADRHQKSADASPFPKSVFVAGVTWIVWGCLIVATGALHVLVHVEEGAQVVGGMWNGVLGAFLGTTCLVVGVWCCKRTLKDALGNGAASIVFGLLYFAYGISRGQAALGGLGEEIVNNLLGLASLLCALGLLAAGALALIGRQKYTEWRRTHA